MKTRAVLWAVFAVVALGGLGREALASEVPGTRSLASRPATPIPPPSEWVLCESYARVGPAITAWVPTANGRATSVTRSWRNNYRDWCNECCWGAEIGLGAWLPGMFGTMGVGDDDLELDTSAWDLISNLGTLIEGLEFILQGGVDIEYGRWRLGLELSALEFGDAIPFKLQGAEVDVKAALVNWQANVYYRAGMSRLSGGSCPKLLVYEPYVGVRGMSVDAETDFRVLGRELDKNHHWVDPVVGVKLTLDFRSRWAIDIEGDVGGFGVASDLTWKVGANVGWRFARQWYLRAGWNVISTDYETGSGASRFQWDVTQSGPFLAISFAF